MTRVLTSTEALPELEQLLRRRTALGLDGRDEMWDGVLHMVPPPGGPHQILSGHLLEVLGPRARSYGLVMAPEAGLFDPGDPGRRWRVPDLVAARPEHWTDRGVEGPAALVVEVLSPGDESLAKLPFYAEMGVAEVLIIEPRQLAFTIHRLAGDAYLVTDDGRLDSLDLDVRRTDEATGPCLRLSWPGGGDEVRPLIPPAR